MFAVRIVYEVRYDKISQMKMRSETIEKRGPRVNKKDSKKKKRNLGRNFVSFTKYCEFSILYALVRRWNSNFCVQHAASEYTDRYKDHMKRI